MRRVIAGIATIMVLVAGGTPAATAAGDVVRAGPFALSVHPPATLVVVIRDRQTRRPIPLVTVLDTDSRTGAMSDPHGIARLNGLSPGRLRLRLSNEGYFGKDATVLVRAGRTDTLRVALRRDPRPRKERMIMVDIKRPAWMW